MVKLIDYDEAISDDLRDPEFAALLLDDALTGEDAPTTFLLALRRIVKARANMSDVAREMKASRYAEKKAALTSAPPEPTITRIDPTRAR